MTPTVKLRVIERFQPILGTNYGGKIQVLQQWWAVERAGQITPTGEWRDVPVLKEAEL
jgi:hypothetical protein